MIQGIVLAGGKSERMGSNKMLLPLFDSTVIEHNIRLLLEVVDEVLVVTGKFHREIAAYVCKHLGHLEVRVVENKNYEQGMFTSVQLGVSKSDGDMLVVPGDSPFYSVDTLKKLLVSDGDFIVPSYNKRGGHPIIIRQGLKASLLEEVATSNLKVFRNKQKVTWLEVNDPGILIDMDTKEDYEAHK